MPVSCSCEFPFESPMPKMTPMASAMKTNGRPSRDEPPVLLAEGVRPGLLQALLQVVGDVGGAAPSPRRCARSER